MDDFNKGLQKAAENHGVKITVQKPPTRIQPEQQPPVVNFEMKRFFAAVGFLFFCLCMYAAAGHGALDGVMEVAAWGIVAVFGIGFVHGALSN